MSYANTDVVIICYDIAHIDSFNNVKLKWIPEITKNIGPNTNIMLVGTKEDLRTD